MGNGDEGSCSKGRNAERQNSLFYSFIHSFIHSSSLFFIFIFIFICFIRVRIIFPPETPRDPNATLLILYTYIHTYVRTYIPYSVPAFFPSSVEYGGYKDRGHGMGYSCIYMDKQAVVGTGDFPCYCYCHSLYRPYTVRIMMNRV